MSDMHELSGLRADFPVQAYRSNVLQGELPLSQ
jgi:hypothetical protein